MPPARLENLPQIHPDDRAAWRDWLIRHHADWPGGSIWLVFWKASSGKARLTYAEAVEEALCFGWIDSLPRRLDDERSRLLMSPRKAKSAWSALNKERAERMIAEERMMPAGLALIELAKKNGLWTKLDAVDALIVPDDLAAALTAQPLARAHFDAFPRSVRRGILEWIIQARRPETRAARIEQTATLAARNERANQWRGARA